VSLRSIPPRQVYTSVKQETIGAWSATLVWVKSSLGDRTGRRRLFVIGAAVMIAAAAVLAIVGLNHARLSFEDEHTRPLAIGDCVAVASSAPDAVRARRSSCGEDPSYTVGAVATAAGNCPSTEYQHFPAPAADQATAGLCLVPNLIAKHCYRLAMPIGVVERADCADQRTDPAGGVLVQVTQRLDVRDQHACPSASGQFAWPYPSPARTYCTATLY
jgi:hypothetical protein